MNDLQNATIAAEIVADQNNPDIFLCSHTNTGKVWYQFNLTYNLVNDVQEIIKKALLLNSKSGLEVHFYSISNNIIYGLAMIVGGRVWWLVPDHISVMEVRDNDQPFKLAPLKPPKML